MRPLNIYVYVLLLASLSCSFGYNYLMVLHTASKSHYYVGVSLAKGLLAAGHEVTLISPFSEQKPIERLRHVPTPEIIRVMGSHIAKLMENSKLPMVRRLPMIHGMGLQVTETFLKEPSVQALLQQNKSYDAVICEVFVNEAHFGLAEHFNAPLIALSSFGASAWTTALVGTPAPPSYVPHNFLQFGDQMTSYERALNFAFTVYEYIYHQFSYLPQQEQLYRKYFPGNKQDFYDMRKNTALVLLNQHVSLSFPRPYAPNMIEVGGMHINRKRQPLPADIEEFINGAEHGVIYFSMGSNLKSADLPPQKRQAFINTFRRLKQRVLWKFEDPNFADKPPNVYISDWFPQDDILSHDKVIAFITHGGLLSSMESIYHGKPVIGIPIFGDQFLNMARAEKSGYGITVRLAQLTTESFTDAIERITNQKSYIEAAKAMSSRFRDQLETPLERAVFWVEHVTRQKGARYLRSAAQNLNIAEYYNLDIIVMFFGGLAFIVFALLFILVTVVRLLLSRLSSKHKPITNKVKIK
ncbi:2-hydroxyacylsphingosine 1-beta-galactosyltransferase-like [Scaptodrosophila lebanonensis]|uniref:UDP-glucuronosyltransferase n=1 Tax=Drosophila lebanonensis TaxID=7225 RepID=A0A6J2TEQ0_DROLE|nr:2-hydroxyacylsphingosine 1-beta-galactosyltransferase-like [Scaptodrosophila lebanonensis]